MKKIVLLRHGESAWNKENRFTGWTDVDLTEKGVAEAEKAQAEEKKLGEDGFVDNGGTETKKQATTFNSATVRTITPQFFGLML